MLEVIPIIAILMIGVLVCLSAITLMAGLTNKQKAARKAAAKAKLTAGSRAVGIHKDHIRAGKMMVVGGLVSVPFLESSKSGDGLSPIEYILPGDDANGQAIQAKPWSKRVDGFLRGCAQNLTGKGNPPGHEPGSGSMVSGKIIVAGSVVHVVGKLKAVKKLTAGLPIRP